MLGFILPWSKTRD